MLEDTLRDVLTYFTPAPPPLRIAVKKAQTFAVDLSKMTITVPEWWSEVTHLRELVGHEVKHASGDGLPYTYVEALRHEAYVIKRLDVPLNTARNILNVIYDAVVDLRLCKEGLDVKGMCLEWLQRYPLTPQNEGSSYHLLQVMYKEWFGVPLVTMRYEKQLKHSREFEELKTILKSLASAGELRWLRGDCAWKVVRAAEIIYSLSKIEEMFDVDFDRGDPNVRSDAAEIGLEAQLDEQRLAEFMGVGEDELNEVLEEVAEDKARTVLWRKIMDLGFKEFFSAQSVLELKEQILRRWRPYSRRVDPASIAKAPDDPRKWREPIVETVATAPEGEVGGFSKIILLIDCSESTAARYCDRTVLSYIKDAAYGLIVYGKRFGLPVIPLAFHSRARVLSNDSRNYVEHAKKIFLLRPEGGTDLEDAVRAVMGLKPEKALIALLTDGFVDAAHLERFAEQSKVNRLVVAVASVEGVETIRKIGDRAQLFVVKPDSVGRTIVDSLPFKRVEHVLR